jgi:hypothetical protein
VVRRTITVQATLSVVSSGFGISSTFSQTTGIIQPEGFSCVQTSGIKINATATNLPTPTFAPPTVSTTLAFSVTAADSNGQVSASTSPVVILGVSFSAKEIC